MKMASIYGIARLGMLAAALGVAAALGMTAPPAFAQHPPLHVDPDVKECSIEFSADLTQSAFHRFVTEFGSVSAFKLATGPVTIGRHRAAIGIEETKFKVAEHSDAWNDTFVHPHDTHELGSDLAFPRLRARYGLADNLDVGAFFSKNFSANYGWVGLDLLYSPIRQSEKMPITASVRAAYTRTLYVHDLDAHALTTDFVIGRTFAGSLTPYFNFGSDQLIASERSDLVDLKRETPSVSHAIGGLEYRMSHVAVAAEIGRAALTSAQVHVTALF